MTFSVKFRRGRSICDLSVFVPEKTDQEKVK